jgi:hypothetical protein
MGRTSCIGRIFTNKKLIFDEKMTLLSTTDFFLRAKKKAQSFKIEDSETLDLCGSDSPILGEDICDELITHKIMLGGGHWAYEGTLSIHYQQF